MAIKKLKKKKCNCYKGVLGDLFTHNASGSEWSIVKYTISSEPGIFECTLKRRVKP